MARFVSIWQMAQAKVELSDEGRAKGRASVRRKSRIKSTVTRARVQASVGRQCCLRLYIAM